MRVRYSGAFASRKTTNQREKESIAPSVLCSLQINHINKLLALFKNRMIIVIDKKIPDPVRYRKTAAFIEGDCRIAVAGSNEHNLAVRIMRKQKLNQHLTIAFAVILRQHGDIFQLINAVALSRYHTLSFDAAIIKDEHIALFKVLIQHTLLLVCEEQKVEMLLFFAGFFSYRQF